MASLIQPLRAEHQVFAIAPARPDRGRSPAFEPDEDLAGSTNSLGSFCDRDGGCAQSRLGRDLWP